MKTKIKIPAHFYPFRKSCKRFGFIGILILFKSMPGGLLSFFGLLPLCLIGKSY